MPAAVPSSVGRVTRARPAAGGRSDPRASTAGDGSTVPPDDGCPPRYQPYAPRSPARRLPPRRRRAGAASSIWQGVGATGSVRPGEPDPPARALHELSPGLRLQAGEVVRHAGRAGATGQVWLRRNRVQRWINWSTAAVFGAFG